MVKNLVKTGIARGLHGTGMDRWLGKRLGAATMPLIISYHRVVEDFRSSARRSLHPMLITTKTLESHLDWIGRRYDYVSLDDLASRLQSGDKLNRPLAAITFDDGYSDVYEHGFPLLNRKGVPSAVFVVTDRVDTTELHIHDGLYVWLSYALAKWKYPAIEIGRVLEGLDINPAVEDSIIKSINDPYRLTRLCLANLPPYVIRKIIAGISVSVDADKDIFREFYSMNWEMLREMSRSDVTVGSHTKSHVLLTNEARQKMLAELSGSRLAAEQKLGMPVEHFAYPDGRFNPEVVQAVKEAGYRYAYTTCMHRDPTNPLLTIPRRVMWEHTSRDAFDQFSPAMMSCQVNGVFDQLGGCNQTHRR